MLILVTWVIWSFINGLIAANNRRNAAGALFGSLLLSPLLIWIYLIAVGKNDEPVQPPVIVAPKPSPPPRVPKPVKVARKPSVGNQLGIVLTGTLCLIVIAALFVH